MIHERKFFLLQGITSISRYVDIVISQNLTMAKCISKKPIIGNNN